MTNSVVIVHRHVGNPSYIITIEFRLRVVGSFNAPCELEANIFRVYDIGGIEVVHHDRLGNLRIKFEHQHLKSGYKIGNHNTK